MKTMAPSLLPERTEPSCCATKVDPQPTLWETILPPEFLALPPGLAQIDRLLEGPVFFEPFVPFFDPLIGRPSIPMETYLRMMFLRFRYRLGFETLCAEVTDSLAWRRFCRIAITHAVPHPSTLMKITTRCGEGPVDQLNEALLKKAMAAHVVKLDKVRADTTVVPANVAYPTDSGLLTKGVAHLTTAGRPLEARAGGPNRFRTGPARCADRALHIAAWLRRRSADAKDEVLALTAEMATITQPSSKDALAVARNARRALRRGVERRARRAPSSPSSSARSRARASRRPDPHPPRRRDPRRIDAHRVAPRHRRPAHRQGTPRAPRRVRLQGPGRRQRRRHRGRPLRRDGQPARRADAGAAIGRIKERFSKVPRAVTADRGYGEAKVEAELHELGVTHVAIPRKGAPVPPARVESARRFRKLVKWRTGSKDASHTSSTPGAGSAPGSTASTGRARGAAGASWPTTPPRSPC